MIRKPPKTSKKKGRHLQVPRVRKADRSCRVDNLKIYSPAFQKQSWQRYRIKDTDRGPEVWEVKWKLCWRKQKDRMPSKQHTLIIARSVRTGEVKYFLTNRVVGRNGTTLRRLLQVAFGRWAIEACFRTSKEELGMDHFEVRGWRRVHRHWYVTQLSFLFASRLRERWDDFEKPDPLKTLSLEQVRTAINTYLQNQHLTTAVKHNRYQALLDRIDYHQTRNAKAKKSRTKTRIKEYERLGVVVDKIKSCDP